MQKASSPINLRKLAIVSATCTVAIAAIAAIVVGIKWPEQASYNIPYILIATLLYFPIQDILILATAISASSSEAIAKKRHIFLALLSLAEIAAIVAMLLDVLCASNILDHDLAMVIIAIANLILGLDGILLCTLIVFSIAIVVIGAKEKSIDGPFQPISQDGLADVADAGSAAAESSTAKYYRGIFCIPLFCCLPFFVYGLQAAVANNIYSFFNGLFLLILCIIMVISTLPAVGFILSFASDNKGALLMAVTHILIAILVVIAGLAVSKDSLVWVRVLTITITVISAAVNIIAIHQTRKHLC